MSQEIWSENHMMACSSVYLSVSTHLDLGDLIRAVSEHINVHLETNEEVLLRCLQEVLEEPGVPVKERRSGDQEAEADRKHCCDVTPTSRQRTQWRRC